MEKIQYKDVDDYISRFKESQREILTNIRFLIQEEAPNAEECISYQMPAYKLNGALLYFAMYEKHLGIYPTGSAIPFFEEELKSYKTSKGAIQFQLKEEIPYDLIRKIVAFRVKQNLAKTKK
ncbi:MAG: DUF1801 domain-containing protein [Bacteroidota bacterium]